jgi:TolB protein
MIKMLLSILFCACTLQAAAPPQEIRVYLSTTTPLEPVYIGTFTAENTSLDAQYLSQLETILSYDFKHNGSCKVLPHREQSEQLLRQKSLTPASWKGQGASYVIAGSVKDKQLNLSVLSVGSGSVKQFTDISLTGILAKDRRQIHRLADAIHKLLFDEEGICSTRILYSTKLKNSSSKSARSAQSSWISEIWGCDWDGANAQQLTREGSYSITPVCIPSNKKYANDRFLYVSYKTGQPKIFISALGQAAGKRLIDLKGNQLLPAISPQRDKVAFICDAGGRTDLFLQKFNPETGDVGKPVQLFSYPRSTQASPTFSPDGSKIAFVSDKDGPPRIYLIAAEPSAKRPEPVLLTKQNNEKTCPAWSPDGKKLAYSAKTKGVRQIWIYDFEAKEERQLTDGPGNKENPSWAPDSKHLVFNSTGGDTSELFIVNLNQPEAIKISQGPGIKHYPTWGTR